MPLPQDSASRRLAKVLNRPLFRIDELACVQAADAIRSYRASTDASPWGGLSAATQLTFKLAFVAICHQINWDFLQQRLAEHLLSDQEEMTHRLASVRAADVSRWLSGYPKPQRIQASDRAEMLRAIGAVLISELEGDAWNLVLRAAGQLDGATGFVAQLDLFEPYRGDPLRKKSNVLVQDLIRERIVRFHDELSIRPAVDYHIMRLYLRTGRVVPTQPVVAEILMGKPRPRARLVRLLREAVGDALQATAKYAGLSVSDVNYIEWQIGRAVCDRKRPACTDSTRDVAIARDVAALYETACPYIDFCQAVRNPEWRKLSEPNFISRFY